MTRPREIALLSFYHVGSLFAATVAIITTIEAINAFALWLQVRRDG